MTRFSARIASAAKKKKSRIIVALDPRPGTRNPMRFAAKTIRAVAAHACAIKVNFHLLLPLSAKEISALTKLAHSHGLQCIADIKMNDIASTNEAALEHLVNMGFDAVIANPFMGAGTLASLAQKAHKKGVGVIALLYMSHEDAREGYGLMTEAGKMYMQFLERAAGAGADGIVVGATQADVLREVAGEIKRRGTPMPIYSPGIGAQGGDIAAAARDGSDYFIVGRSIVEAADPARAAHELQLRSS